MNMVLSIAFSLMTICAFALALIGLYVTIVAERYEKEIARLRRTNAGKQKTIEHLQEQIWFIEDFDKKET